MPAVGFPITCVASPGRSSVGPVSLQSCELLSRRFQFPSTRGTLRSPLQPGNSHFKLLDIPLPKPDRRFGDWHGAGVDRRPEFPPGLDLPLRGNANPVAEVAHFLSARRAMNRREGKVGPPHCFPTGEARPRRVFQRDTPLQRQDTDLGLVRPAFYCPDFFVANRSWSFFSVKALPRSKNARIFFDSSSSPNPNPTIRTRVVIGVFASK